ncbi:uncharacterized protein PHACADRAFT_157472 [Phanerochaete carnosa HHB-10118-sp]|uniref:PIN domain-containing protein n=1 Tax=Phanerochaete carnosa (strain HHB-10118-sp) TaxID=650164 RepID=K5X8I3_PHACS|nr:uncharacterized protein PHACADRAFT_157472 [Phanerochaete carnosa HHB-10118-sp]EKM59192.1 hypothetical protein PHACADRAFT_157472 [Phanerochaete carnosa HHB-10118-sp]
MLAVHPSQLRHSAAGASSWQPSAVHGADSVRVKDDTLARITNAANDVEMLEPVDAGPTLYLVLDTNVLIDNLNVIRSFSEDLDHIALPWSMKIIVPYVVLSELDGLKKREGLSWFARTASTFLLQKVKEKKSLKVQARSETVNTQLHEHEQARSADITIWDCCQYYKTKGEVVLLSNDINLQTLCENEEPPPGRRLLSSRELAAKLFGEHLDVSPFRVHENAPRYRPTRLSQTHHLAQTEGPKADEPDGMDVDDDGAAAGTESWVPSHALDALHIQIIDHFTVVLAELAQRVRHEAGDDGPPARSPHAPEHRRKGFRSWNVRDCVEYLESKKAVEKSQPPLQMFLLRRSEDRGWRRGQDWPRQAWENCLDALEDIGRQFEDGLVLLSLTELRPHVTDVFNTRLRPTGI